MYWIYACVQENPFILYKYLIILKCINKVKCLVCLSNYSFSLKKHQVCSGVFFSLNILMIHNIYRLSCLTKHNLIIFILFIFWVRKRLSYDTYENKNTEISTGLAKSINWSKINHSNNFSRVSLDVFFQIIFEVS